MPTKPKTEMPGAAKRLRVSQLAKRGPWPSALVGFDRTSPSKEVQTPHRRLHHANCLLEFPTASTASSDSSFVFVSECSMGTDLIPTRLIK